MLPIRKRKTILKINTKNNKKYNSFYPHIILNSSDKLVKDLSINQIVGIIIVGFFIIFGLLAIVLPSKYVSREFVSAYSDDGIVLHSPLTKPMADNTDNTVNTATIVNINNNVDNAGHVQIFYYPWYGNPQNDNQYIHWNHDILPHWDATVNKKYKIGSKYRVEDDEIGASYWPLLGAYSSSSSIIIQKHFKMLCDINVTVIIVSWHSPIAIKNNPNKAFSAKDKITAQNLDLLFKYAAIYSIKIAIHLEPYNGRTAQSTYNDIKYLYDKYSNYASYFKSVLHDNKPFYYLYDSYKMSNNEWAKLFIRGIDNNLCLRDTEYDAIFLGLYLNKNPSETHLKEGGFDGFYTYFAANGFTDGSSPNNHWKHIAQFALRNQLIFVPSLGVGYNDIRVRPWNKQNTKQRDNGNYYKIYWDKVFDLNDNLLNEMNAQIPNQLIKQYQNDNKINDDDDDDIIDIDNKNTNVISYVSITSFNEWHEGTQIEPSIPKISKNGYKYLDFEKEGGPYAYMKMTHKYVTKFLKQIN